MNPMLEPLERRALLSGEIDTSFGTNGVTTTDFDAYSERFSRVVAGTDGKVYASGVLGGKFLVARYTADGQLDPSFNGTGFVQVPLSTGYAANGLAVRADGEIFLGGSQAAPAGATACVVALKPDGTLDPAFSGDGVWTGYWVSTLGSQINTVTGLALDGNTLYAGGDNGASLVVTRFTSAGEIDTTFANEGPTGNHNGRAIVPVASGQAVTSVDFRLVKHPGGASEFLIVGNASRNGPMMAEVTPGGAVDSSFATYPFFNTSSYQFRVTRVAVDAGGGVVVGGNVAQRGTVARLTATGAVDTAFATSGFYTATDNTQYTVTSVAALPDGQTLFTGPGGNLNTTAGDRVTALTAAGRVNLTYFDGQAATLPVQNVSEAFVQPDGKVLLAGRQYLGGDAYDTQVMRLNAVTPPTTVSGYLFDDVNGDGLQNDTGGATTFYGLSAYLDANHNGDYDAGEVTSYAGTGKFVFDNVAPGTVDVGLYIPTGLRYTQTSPAAGGTLRVTTAGPLNTVGPFGVRQTPLTYAAVGYTYTDSDASGTQNTNEERVAGVTIYDDANNNGRLDSGENSVVSNVSGYFSLDLTPGNHTLRQIPLAGQRAVSQYLTTYVSGNTFAVDSVLRVPTDTANNQLRFGSRPLTRVGGYAFNDLDGDGTQDSGEAITTDGGFVYVDSNNNGVYDAATDQAATASPGAPGYFELLVGPGTYTLRQSPTGGWQQTLPAGDGALTISIAPSQDSLANVVFGRRLPPAPPATFTVSGRAFIDTNKNGVRDGTEGDNGELDTWYVYVDTDNSGDVSDADLYATTVTGAGRYTLTLPADGQTYRVRFSNENLATEPFTTAAYYDVSSTTNGQAITGRDFGIAPVARGAGVTGRVFNDANKNGVQDAGEAGLANVKVYIDLDNDKILDANEIWTNTDSNGSYGFSDLPNTGAATRLRVVLPAGSTQITPANGNGYGLNLAVGATNTGKNFALYAAPVGLTGTLSGFAFDDTNKNGRYDSGETKTANKTVFLDLDGDGLLDSNEKKATTGTNGAWSFTGLAAGTYHVRRVFPSGYTQSNPLIDVTLTAGQTVSDLSIGSKSGTTPTPTASISGVAFNDVNRNGLYDSGDTLAAGKTIWLDLDDDGVKDTGEPSMVTDSGGKFAFTGLAARGYHVRRVFSSGYVESTPPRTISLTGGQAVTGVLIGSRTA